MIPWQRFSNPTRRVPKRSRTIPKFLASQEAAERWGDKHIDHNLDPDTLSERAFAYADFAKGAYRSGEIIVYRAVSVPSREHVDFKCLGKAWSREPKGAGVYGSVPWPRGELKTFLITGIVEPKDVDWEYGFTSFLYYGEDQWEISLLENSPVEVTEIEHTPCPRPIRGSSGPSGETWGDTCGPKV